MNAPPQKNFSYSGPLPKYWFTILLTIKFTLQNVNLDEVYGDSRDDEEPKSEISLTNPTNPYAASKAACEVIVRSYHVNLLKDSIIF